MKFGLDWVGLAFLGLVMMLVVFGPSQGNNNLIGIIFLVSVFTNLLIFMFHNTAKVKKKIGVILIVLLCLSVAVLTADVMGGSKAQPNPYAIAFVVIGVVSTGFHAFYVVESPKASSN